MERLKELDSVVRWEPSGQVELFNEEDEVVETLDLDQMVEQWLEEEKDRLAKSLGIAKRVI